MMTHQIAAIPSRIHRRADRLTEQQDTDMKTIQLNIFRFDELDDKAKEKARNWYRGITCDDSFWSEYTIDEVVEQAGYMGIAIDTHQVPLMNGQTRSEPSVCWSGFSSQGDGACFDGEGRAFECHPEQVAEGWGEDSATTEIKRIAAEFGRIAKKYPESSFTVKHRGHYSHENCTEFEFDLGEYPEHRAEIDAEEDALKAAAKDFMRWIYRQLEKEYEYHRSNEAVDENIEANEYDFMIDGTPSRF